MLCPVILVILLTISQLSLNFVDLITGAHMNTIEGRWLQVKFSAQKVRITSLPFLLLSLRSLLAQTKTLYRGCIFIAVPKHCYIAVQKSLPTAICPNNCTLYIMNDFPCLQPNGIFLALIALNNGSLLNPKNKH